MARLVLFALVLVVIAISALAVGAATGRVGRASDAAPRHPGDNRGDLMPDAFRTFAYVALLLLMLGIVTGLVGGA